MEQNKEPCLPTCASRQIAVQQIYDFASVLIFLRLLDLNLGIKLIDLSGTRSGAFSSGIAMFIASHSPRASIVQTSFALTFNIDVVTEGMDGEGVENRD